MQINKPDLPPFCGRQVPIHSDEARDLRSAKDMAKEAAKRLCRDPMLLSWYDGLTGRSHPNFECGAARGKPPWIVFAEARGGDIMVDVNDGAFIFIYLGLD